MSKRCGLRLALSLAVLFLAPAALGQEAEKKMPVRSVSEGVPERHATTRRTGCEPDTCISKVLHLPNFSTLYELQDVVNMFRAILEITHVTPNQPEHAISLQGTPEQLAIAERLVSVLESLRSSGGHNRSSVLVYEPEGSLPEPAVSEKAPEQPPVAAPTTHCELTTCFIKALYLPDFSISQLQDALNKLHSKVHIARITVIPSSHAIVLQGTSEQLVRAERLTNE
jgi:hypothetical protein